MSPEERLKELASSKQDMWRVLTLLGMSPETVEQAIAFRTKHPHQETMHPHQEKPHPRRKLRQPQAVRPT
jgi:hypothetical protein